MYVHTHTHTHAHTHTHRVLLLHGCARCNSGLELTAKEYEALFQGVLPAPQFSALQRAKKKSPKVDNSGPCYICVVV